MTRNITNYFLACFTIMGLLAGCGSESSSSASLPGGASSDSSSSTAKLATPSVTTTVPFNGQLNVATGTTITATFSFLMKFATINSSTFTVSDNFGTTVPGTISFTGLNAVFTPNAPLVINRTYTVTLSGAIESKDGQGLKPLTWTFNTSTDTTPLQLSSHHVTDNGAYSGAGNIFAYEDISTTGANSGVTGDDSSGSIPIGFTFSFYGTNYSSAYVSTNGFLTFGASNSTYSNYQFPSNDGIPRIAAWFDDLYIDGPAKIVYEVKGVAPNRRLIVQWNQVRHFSGSTRGDFEIILYEGSNNIQLQYLNANLTPYANGSSATVGLNKGDGIDNTLYSYNTAYLSNGRSITFIPASTYGLTTLTPLNLAVGVSRSVGVYAFFNKPLDVSTIAGSFSLVKTAGSVPVGMSMTVGVGAGNSVLFSLPSGSLDATTNFTATISTALADIYGIHLAAPITWSFTTGL